jgi:hypothetical protein
MVEEGRGVEISDRLGIDEVEREREQNREGQSPER